MARFIKEFRDNYPELVKGVGIVFLSIVSIGIFVGSGLALAIFEAVLHVPVNITFGSILFMGAVYVVSIAFNMITALRKVEGCRDVAVSFILFALGAAAMGAYGWRFITGLAAQLNVHGMTVMNLYVPGAAFWPLLIIGCAVTASGMPTVISLIKKSWNEPISLDKPEATVTSRDRLAQLPKNIKNVFWEFFSAGIR